MRRPALELSDEELKDRLLAARRATIELAREDVNVFAARLLQDEKTGKPIRQAPLHRAMHAAMDAHDRVVIWGFVESGKSAQVEARIIHALGRDPSLRIGLVGKTHKQAEKTLKKIATMIRSNPTVREVFPHLKPGTPWRDNAITVQRPVVARDPSIQVIGVAGTVLGARLDQAYLDDVVDLENSKTEHGRTSLRDWILNTLFGRLTAGARVVVIGNAYHPEDLMHFLEKLEGWKGFRFPVMDPRTGEPTWPERWPVERIEEKRKEVGPLEFARTMMCQPRSEDDSRFKRADIDICLRRGIGLGANFATSFDGWRPDWPLVEKERCRFYVGVDLAVQIHAAADISAIFCIAVHPDGTRELVGLESGRWPAQEIIQRIGAAYRRWRGAIVVIENVAAQEWMRQFVVQLEGVPAIPYTTGRGKASLEFQAEGLAAEIANHRWVIPCGDAITDIHPETAEWITALLFYNPSAHTPDRMAASLFARFQAQRGDPAEGLDLRARIAGGGSMSTWGQGAGATHTEHTPGSFGGFTSGARGGGGVWGAGGFGGGGGVWG